MQSKVKKPLRQRIRELESAVIGNRFNLLSSTAIAVGIELAGTGIYSLSLGDLETADGFFSISLLPTFFGSFLKLGAKSGRGTRELYIRTKKHIDKRGSLDPRFVKRLSQIMNRKYEEASDVYGCCELQGAYLAAREAGPESVKVFRKAKRAYSEVVIPNF